MTLQPDRQPAAAPEPAPTVLPEEADLASPEARGERVLEALRHERLDSAAALLRQLLAADRGILLERAYRNERRLLLDLLSLEELSDILDEAPTGAAVTIVHELTAERAANLLDDVDTHTPSPTSCRNCPGSRLRLLSPGWAAPKPWFRCSNTRLIPLVAL